MALKGAVGLYAQPPDPTAFSRDFGNPDILPEHGTQYVAGRRGGAHAGRDRRDCPLLEEPARPGRPRPEPRRSAADNDGLGRAYGGEVLIRQNLGKHLFGWVAYTLSRSERKDHPGQDWYLFEFDQTNILTVMLSYLLPRGFRWVRAIATSPEMPTPRHRLVLRLGPTSTRRWPAPTNSARLGPFNQLDLRVDKVFTFDRWRFSAYLDVQNVLRADNPEAVGYNYDYTIPHPITGLPLLPILGIRGDF